MTQLFPGTSFCGLVNSLERGLVAQKSCYREYLVGRLDKGRRLMVTKIFLLHLRLSVLLSGHRGWAIPMSRLGCQVHHCMPKGAAGRMSIRVDQGRHLVWNCPPSGLLQPGESRSPCCSSLCHQWSCQVPEMLVIGLFLKGDLFWCLVFFSEWGHWMLALFSYSTVDPWVRRFNFDFLFLILYVCVQMFV